MKYIFGSLFTLLTMLSLYLGWNEGVLPLLQDGLSTIGFLQCFWLYLFVAGIAAPLRYDIISSSPSHPLHRFTKEE